MCLTYLPKLFRIFFSRLFLWDWIFFCLYLSTFGLFENWSSWFLPFYLLLDYLIWMIQIWWPYLSLLMFNFFGVFFIDFLFVSSFYTWFIENYASLCFSIYFLCNYSNLTTHVTGLSCYHELDQVTLFCISFRFYLFIFVI